MSKEPEHYTGENAEQLGCWCNPTMEYIEETDTWVIVHNSLTEREEDERKVN